MWPDGVERVAHDVVRADGHAARHDDDVRLGDAPAQPRLDVLQAVRGDAELERHRARLADQRPDPRAVGVGDPRGSEVGPGRADLVAGREHRHDRAAAHADLGQPGAGRQRDHGRRHQHAGGDDRRAGLHVAAALADGVPGRDGFVDEARGGQRAGGLATAGTGAARGIERRRDLHRHHRVGARGHRRAGRDPDRRLAEDTGIGRGPGPRLADDGQAHGPGARGRRDVGGTHRVPVHRRVVPGRQRDAGHQRRGEHAAERDLGRDALDVGQRLDARQHRRLGGVDAQQIAAHRVSLPSRRGPRRAAGSRWRARRGSRDRRGGRPRRPPGRRGHPR